MGVFGGPLMFISCLFLEREMQGMRPLLRVVQLSTSVASVVAGAIFMMLVLCLRRHWGFICVGRQSILAYGFVMLAYQVLMVLINPGIAPAFCEAYVRSGFTPTVFS